MSQVPANLNPEQRDEYHRLFWHSRRGMLELDVLLVPFLQEAYFNLPEEDQARYRKLLNCEDQDMFNWVMQKSVPEDADLARIVKIILDRVQPD
ncbi:MAG: succinate dehydrogenase assembly factor 2 [Oleiphilaceae bacterium]|nr:succinate dehydrogenase assembly factor 2 [Oleiphilaceae bacterium]